MLQGPYYFFSRFWGVLGPLTYTKTLENWHTCWNLRPLGRRRGWEPGVAQGLYGAPWITVRKQMYISHILAHIHMKLGTHIDLIELNKFQLHVIGSAQQEVGYLGLFKKCMLWNLIYSSEDYHPIATKLCEHDLKILGMLNCEDIFDISNGLPVARR